MFKQIIKIGIYSYMLATTTVAQQSPWDNGQVEIKVPVKCPIKYKTVFTRERKMFNYTPRFMPGILRFSPENQPVMRCGINPPSKPGDNHASFPKSFFSEKNYIQYLASNGRWTASTKHLDAIREYLKLKPADKLLITAGERCPDSIEFDNDGNAYTIVKTKYFKNGQRRFGSFLLYSKDNFKSWQVYPVTGSNLRLESYRPNADHSKPPVITTNRGGISLIIPEKTANGRLKISPAIQLVPASVKAIAAGAMAGASNQCITSHGKTFVTYMSTLPVKGNKGTPQYIISYDHRNNKIKGPVLLGFSGHRIDGHNTPVIDLSPKGHVHVIGGTHWHGAPHWTSKKPYSISSGWNKPEYIGGNNKDSSYSLSGISYPGFIIKKDGTMHLTTRGRSATFEDLKAKNPKIINYALVYFRKLPGGCWSKRRDLVIPAWIRYSNWYHKSSIDRKGNPFLTYYYIALRLEQVPKAQQEYFNKWKKELTNGKLPTGKTTLAHDPVLIGSRDNGNIWKIIQTKDFTKNRVKK